MIEVYGASDDLIEVTGDIIEDFRLPYDGTDMPHYLGFSDGTILRIGYDDDGVWRITPVAHGSAELSVVQAPVDDDDNYSDRATLENGGVRWVVFGSAYGTTTG